MTGPFSGTPRRVHSLAPLAASAICTRGRRSEAGAGSSTFSGLRAGARLKAEGCSMSAGATSTSCNRANSWRMSLGSRLTAEAASSHEVRSSRS